MEDCFEPNQTMKYSFLKKIKFPIINRMLELNKNDLLLDVGSGAGIFAEKLADSCKKTIAIDINWDNIKIAKNQIKNKNISYIVCDAVYLPFKKSIFNKILATEIIEHIKRDDLFVKELSHVLSDDGTIVITTPCNNPSIHLEGLRKKTGVNFEHAFGHMRSGYTKESLSKLLGKFNLKIIKTSYYLQFFGELARSLTHLGRKTTAKNLDWTSGEDLKELEGNKLFELYKIFFPLVYLFAKLDFFISGLRGHQIAVKVTKQKI